MRRKYCLGNFLPHFNGNVLVGLSFLSFILLPYVQSTGSMLTPRFITETHSFSYVTDMAWVASSVGAGVQEKEIIASERKSLETCRTTLTSFVIKEQSFCTLAVMLCSGTLLGGVLPITILLGEEAHQS